MSKLKGVIFDLDGTLINSLEAYTKAFNFGVQKFGSRPASKRELRDFLDKGYSLEDILQKLYPDFESKEKRQRCVNEIRNAYLGIEKEVGLIHRAAEVLSSLKKRGLKIGIVTGRMIHGEMKWLELRRLEIASFIDAMITDAEALPKPSPDGIIKCLEELGLLVNEALFIGNSTVDVIAGRKAKVKTFLLADDDLLRSDLNKESVRTINNLEEILEILNEH